MKCDPHMIQRKASLSVIGLWRAPPIVREYLESGEEAIRSLAHSAAKDAADFIEGVRCANWAGPRPFVFGAYSETIPQRAIAAAIRVALIATDPRYADSAFHAQMAEVDAAYAKTESGMP